MPSDRLNQLRKRILDTLRPLVGGQEVALLDFPNHSNCGDSAIWLGEEAALKALGCRILYRADLASFKSEAVARLPEACVILLHGGGNFGDLYPRHQQFRELILKNFSTRKVIQLPQTVHFADRRAAEASALALSGHRQFTLLVRDQPSLEVSKTVLRCDAQICPDMAFALQLPPVRPPTSGVTVLARTDAEARTSLAAAAAMVGLVSLDWYDATQSQRLTTTGLLRRLVTSLPPGRAQPLYSLLARRETARALRLISGGSVLLTDRLHAHILAELIGLPHVVVDTGYGKLQSVHDAWLTDSPTSRIAASPEEGCRLALSLAMQG